MYWNWPLKRHLLLLLTLSGLTVLSITFFDRAIVWQMQALGTRQWPALQTIQALPEAFVYLLPAVIAVLVLAKLLNQFINRFNAQRLHYHLQFCLHSGSVLLLSLALKTPLKFVFARTWPDTFKLDNPSLINDGVYGFFWFEPGVWYMAFPSGHSLSAVIMALVFAYYYPALRYLSYAFAAAVMGALILLYYHFLADCLAGLIAAYVLVQLSLWLKNKLAARWAVLA